jgi:Uncharacterized stress protein (general stress protein 26)
MRDTVMTKAKKLMRGKYAYAGSVGEGGEPNIKALFIDEREGSNIFYFASNISSLRVNQYKKNPQACLYFPSGKKIYEGVMLQGRMDILDDCAAKKKILRSASVRCKPDACVLRFTADSGRFYGWFETRNFDFGY